ncbi:MAG: hypothetical protein K2O54_06825 [Prevotella sp.]|nr:hypothetical protein [Prevotella sp.]MDE6012927.1 hypothetical protein [Prevotella sp.]MDE7089816.1 hypothetical protein [Prevotella sp.]
MKNIMFLFVAATLLTACQESLEERAAREARELTEDKCPMPIGNNMMLDSIVFDIPTLTQSQYFRFTGDNDNDSVVFALQDAKSLLVSELKSMPSYKPLMNKGVSFRYVYRSNKNPEKTYLEMTITKEDYR